MTIEGELVLRVDWADGRVTRARARTERPRVARALLTGRRADEAVNLVATLFAICGRSQEVAAASAVEQARGEVPGAGVAAARERRIAAETLREHFWRVFIDWPRLADLEPQTVPMQRARDALASSLDAAPGAPIGVGDVAAIARDCVFGLAPGEWLSMSSANEVVTWCRTGKTPAALAVAKLLGNDPGLGASKVALLAAIDDATIAAVIGPPVLLDPDFDAEPHWNGEPRETGALARVHAHALVAAVARTWGRGVGARVVARLVELAQLCGRFAGDVVASPRHGASRTGDGAGLSWVETARGLLVHRAALENGRIADYRIVAPTEWNFHPRGAFVNGALGLSSESPRELEGQVRRLAASLDPCVAWRVEVGHA